MQTRLISEVEPLSLIGGPPLKMGFRLGGFNVYCINTGRNQLLPHNTKSKWGFDIDFNENRISEELHKVLFSFYLSKITVSVFNKPLVSMHYHVSNKSS